jgi:hypothetical protein
MMNILSSLAVLEYYPKKLIDVTFETNFLRFIQEKSVVPVHTSTLLFITAASIECYPEYQELMSKERLMMLQQRVGHSTIQDLMSKSRPPAFEDLIVKTYLALKQIYKDQVYSCRILPHSSYPDVVVMPRKVKPSDIKPFPLQPGSVTEGSVISLRHVTQYVDYENDRLRGLPSMKLRLLKKMGFKIVELPCTQLQGLSIPSTMRRLRVMMDIPVHG